MFNESLVKTLLIMDTDTLVLEKGSLQPRHSATVILANIEKIIFRCEEKNTATRIMEFICSLLLLEIHQLVVK